MFGPPRGYDDLLGDAECAPPLGEPVDLNVVGVGVLQARRPAPRSTAVLAAITRPHISTAARLGLMQRFVNDHLSDEQVDDLLEKMMSGDLPDDAMGRVSRALCRWGTARPYTAVCHLAGVTGQHWRLIRQHLLVNGVTDPMWLPSMHALLDVTEQLVIESMQGRTPAQTEAKRDTFYNQLYRPDRLDAEFNGEDYQPIPDGFGEGEEDAAFDAFARMQ
jgi:hypothetical protein